MARKLRLTPGQIARAPGSWSEAPVAPYISAEPVLANPVLANEGSGAAKARIALAANTNRNWRDRARRSSATKRNRKSPLTPYSNLRTVRHHG